MGLDRVRRIIPLPLFAITFVFGCVILFAPRYHSAVIPAPGVSIEVLTAPENPLASAILRMRASHELGSPCNYELLGWSDSNELYYSETCYRKRKFWVYSVSGKPIVTHDIPVSLDYTTFNAISYVRVRDWENPEAGISLITKPNTTAEGTYRAMILRGHEQIISPDKNYIALISTHIYGPEEVVVIDIDK